MAIVACIAPACSSADSTLAAEVGDRILPPNEGGHLGYVVQEAEGDSPVAVEFGLYDTAVAMVHAAADSDATDQRDELADELVSLFDEFGEAKSNPVDLAAYMTLTAAEHLPVHVTDRAEARLVATKRHAVAAADPQDLGSYIYAMPHAWAGLIEPEELPSPPCERVVDAVATAATDDDLNVIYPLAATVPEAMASCLSGAMAHDALDAAVAALGPDAWVVAPLVDDLHLAGAVSERLASEVAARARSNMGERATVQRMGYQPELAMLLVWLGFDTVPDGYAEGLAEFRLRQGMTVRTDPAHLVMFADIVPFVEGDQRWRELLIQVSDAPALDPASAAIVSFYLDSRVLPGSEAADTGDVGLGHYGWIFALRASAEGRCEGLDELGLGEVALAIQEARDLVQERCGDVVNRSPTKPVLGFQAWADEFTSAPWGPGMVTRYRCELYDVFEPPVDLDEDDVNIDDIGSVWSWSVLEKGQCP